MRYVLLLMLTVFIASSHGQTAPAITGPATGTCGPIPIRYGTSGSPDAKLQTFVAPAPLFIPNCNPAASDTYVYTLGVGQQSNYILPGPAVRSIGSDVSPAFGYRDTPSLDLTMAVPNSGVSPLPVPAGFLDVTLIYSAKSTNSQCANATNTQTSAFLIQAPTATTVTGPLTSTAGDPSFQLYINVTYPAAAIQPPFSDPAAVQTGAATVTDTSGSPLNGSTSIASSGPGFITYAFTPSPPLPAGAYSVNAAYAPSASYVLGSSSTSPFDFVITPPPTTTVPPTTVTPSTTPAATSTVPAATSTPAPATTKPAVATTKPPASTTKAATPSTKPPVKTPTPTPTVNPAVAAAQARLDADLAKLPTTSGFARLVLLAQIARDYAALAAAQRNAG